MKSNIIKPMKLSFEWILCCAKMIMSPCVQSRNVPFYNLTDQGGQVEKGADERNRGEARGGAEPGSGRRGGVVNAAEMLGGSYRQGKRL